MTAGGVHLDVDTDGALLSHTEGSDTGTVNVLDTAESLVNDERDTVLAIALLNDSSNGPGTTTAANLTSQQCSAC